MIDRGFSMLTITRGLGIFEVLREIGRYVSRVTRRISLDSSIR